MRIDTLLAMAKVRQFEADYESIQKNGTAIRECGTLCSRHGQNMSRCTLVGRMKIMSGHCQARASIGSK